MFDPDMYNRQQQMQQQPYGSNMQNTNPQPMQGMSNNSIPSLQASMLTPNLNAGSFMGGDNGGKPSYKRGGGIRKFMMGGRNDMGRNMRPSNMPRGGEGFIPEQMARENAAGMGAPGQNYMRQYNTDSQGFNNLNNFNQQHGRNQTNAHSIEQINRQMPGINLSPRTNTGIAQHMAPRNEIMPHVDEYIGLENQIDRERRQSMRRNQPMNRNDFSQQWDLSSPDWAFPRGDRAHNSQQYSVNGENPYMMFNQDDRNVMQQYLPEMRERAVDPQQYQTTQAALNRQFPQGLGQNIMDYLYSQPQQRNNRRALNTNPRPLNMPPNQEGEPRLAEGGSIGLKDMLQMLEASREGEQMHEHEVPHYKGGGFLKKIVKTGKKVAQVALPFVGGAIGGPGGAALGGALGGVLGGGRNVLRNSILGAGLGYAGSGGFGNLGGLGQVIPGVNAGVGGMMSGKGMSGFNGLGNAFGLGSAAGAATKGAAGAAGAGGLGEIFSGNTLPLLIGGSLLGTAFSKNKVPHEPSLAQQIGASGMDKRGRQWREPKPTERVARALSDADLASGRTQQFYEDANPETEYYAAHGGRIERHMADGGYLDGHDGGQDDTIPARLSDGEYVLSADVVSNLGDGNNRHGAKKLDKFMSKVRAHKYSKGGRGLPPKAKSLEAYMQARGAR